MSLGSIDLPTNLDSKSKRWQARYAKRHHLKRVTAAALGIELPKRVRLYQRQSHFVLQWWDSAQRRTLNERVDGDLIAAIARARAVEERLLAFKTSGNAVRRLGLLDLLEAFCADLNQRADAGEISPATSRRYRSALSHLRAFAAQPAIEKSYRYASQVDRGFRLSLAAFLQQRQGHRSKSGADRSVCGLESRFILDTCRALFAWASDRERGNYLGDGFLNPFCDRRQRATSVRNIPLGEPDITVNMAADFLSRCDAFQLRLFSIILLCGLRPSEVTYLFYESVDDNWLRVKCLPELNYFTKGRRDKQFPLIDPLRDLIGPNASGLIFVRRGADASPKARLQQFVLELERRWTQGRDRSANQRQRLRDQVLMEHGCLNYDRIEGDFQSVASSLNWPRSATLKDFRHLFSTCLENAGVPEFYRRFLMGQSAGRSAIVGYTHLNKVKDHYAAALEKEFAPIIGAIHDRSRAIAG